MNNLIKEKCSQCSGSGFMWCGDQNSGMGHSCRSCNGTGEVLFVQINAYDLSRILEDLIHGTSEVSSYTLKNTLNELQVIINDNDK